MSWKNDPARPSSLRQRYEAADAERRAKSRQLDRKYGTGYSEYDNWNDEASYLPGTPAPMGGQRYYWGLWDWVRSWFFWW